MQPFLICKKEALSDWSKHLLLDPIDPKMSVVTDSTLLRVGRRACPGEQLARTELFINTVALLQKFTFQAEDPENPPKIQGTSGTTYTPNPFKIVAVPL